MYLAWISRGLLLGCLLSVPLAAQQTAVTEASLLEGLQRDTQDPAAYGRLCLWYLAQGRRADAEELFQRAVNSIPPAAFAPAGAQALAIGDFYLACGKPDQALGQYQLGMAGHALDKPPYLKRQIEVLLRLGRRSEAAELNAQLLRTNPKDADGRGLAASFLLDQGDAKAAIAELQALAKDSPENPVLHFSLGRAYAARGDWEAAKRAWNKALELRPDYVTARLALAQLQVSRGEFDAAWKTAAGVLDFDRGNESARLIQSAALMGQKKFRESRALLEEMLKTNPGSPEVNLQLGSVNLAENRFPEAEAAFRLAYQVNPANSRGLLGLVETAMAQNQPDAALALLQTEIGKSPNRADLQLALANTLVRAGRYDPAIATYQKLLSQAANGTAQQGDLYLRLGETYRRKGDAAAAIQALQKAREAVPDSAVVLNTLALVLDGAGRKPEAAEVYEATLKLDPNHAVVLNNYAFLLAETGGDLDRALALSQRAVQLLPDLTEVSDTLGWIYLKKGMAAQAIEIFRVLVDKTPQSSTYRYHLAMAYQRKGDRAAALREAEAAAKMTPPNEEGKKIGALIEQLSAGK